MADTPPSARSRQRRNVDGGWAYVILIATHAYFFVYCGAGKSLSVMLSTLKEQFDTQMWLLGSVLSIRMAIKDISAITAVLLSSKLPARWIIVISSLVATCSMVFASLAQTVAQFAVCVALLSGAAFGIGFPLIQTLLSQYFHKKYASAYGLASCGVSTGMMAMAPLTQLLLDTYGWRGTMLVIGGISLNLVAVTALARPLAKPKPRETVEDKTGKTSPGLPVASAERGEARNSKKRRRSSVMYLVTKPVPAVSSGIKAFARVSDISLFKEMSYVGVVIVCCVIRFAQTVWAIYFVPHAVEMGFGGYEASLLVTMYGVGNILGKVCHGPLVDRKIVSRRTMLFLSTLVASGLFFCDSLMTTIPSMIAGQLVLGAAIGISSSLFVVLLRRIIGLARMTRGLGWASVSSGAVRILAGFVSGWIYDQTHSFGNVFLVLGCTTAICPVLIIVEAAIHRFLLKNRPVVDERWECVIGEEN